MCDRNLRNNIKKILEKSDTSLSDASHKELLHAEILKIMHKHDMLDTLTFAGGTSLRLCYGNPRLSEDLDFVSSKDYQPELLKNFAEYAQSHFEKLGIDVNVKEPKILRAGSANRNNFDHINIDRWQISFDLTPERPDIPRSRIKLEIATVPAYTREAKRLISHYPSLSPVSNIQIPVESLTEIMADKLISLPASQKYIRYRDIWDLSWMAEKGIKPDMTLIRRKITDYHIDNFTQKINARIDSMSDIMTTPTFIEEMRRFLPPNIIKNQLTGADNQEKITNTINNFLTEVSQSLTQNRAELTTEGMQRAEGIALISGGSHPRTIYRDLAKAALHAHDGNVNAVNWPALERATAIKAIELGYSPIDVVKTISQYSPSCTTEKDQEKFKKEVQRLTPDLKKQFENDKRQTLNTDKTR